jgi:hypothetical protein
MLTHNHTHTRTRNHSCRERRSRNRAGAAAAAERTSNVRKGHTDSTVSGACKIFGRRKTPISATGPTAMQKGETKTVEIELNHAQRSRT